MPSILTPINVLFPPIGSLLTFNNHRADPQEHFFGRSLHAKAAFGTWTGLLVGASIIALFVWLSFLSFGALPALIGVSVGVLWACSVIGRALGFTSKIYSLRREHPDMGLWIICLEAFYFGLLGSISDYRKLKLAYFLPTTAQSATPKEQMMLFLSGTLSKNSDSFIHQFVHDELFESKLLNVLNPFVQQTSESNEQKKTQPKSEEKDDLSHAIMLMQRVMTTKSTGDCKAILQENPGLVEALCYLDHPNFGNSRQNLISRLLSMSFIPSHIELINLVCEQVKPCKALAQLLDQMMSSSTEIYAKYVEQMRSKRILTLDNLKLLLSKQISWHVLFTPPVFSDDAKMTQAGFDELRSLAKNAQKEAPLNDYFHWTRLELRLFFHNEDTFLQNLKKLRQIYLQHCQDLEYRQQFIQVLNIFEKNIRELDLPLLDQQARAQQCFDALCDAKKEHAKLAFSFIFFLFETNKFNSNPKIIARLCKDEPYFATIQNIVGILYTHPNASNASLLHPFLAQLEACDDQTITLILNHMQQKSADILAGMISLETFVDRFMLTPWIPSEHTSNPDEKKPISNPNLDEKSTRKAEFSTALNVFEKHIKKSGLPQAIQQAKIQQYCEMLGRISKLRKDAFCDFISQYTKFEIKPESAMLRLNDQYFSSMLAIFDLLNEHPGLRYSKTIQNPLLISTHTQYFMHSFLEQLNACDDNQITLVLNGMQQCSADITAGRIPLEAFANSFITPITTPKEEPRLAQPPTDAAGTGAVPVTSGVSITAISFLPPPSQQTKDKKEASSPPPSPKPERLDAQFDSPLGP